MKFDDGKPVTGQGLIELRESLGISVADMMWMLGISMRKWSEYTIQRKDEPVSDVTIEILARLLDRHPEYSMIPPEPDVAKFREEIGQIRGEELTLKEFAVLFGRQASSGHRWVNQDATLARPLAHLAQTVMRGLELQPDKQKRLIKEWEDIVRAAGRARGVDDVMDTGRWTKE